MSKIDTPPAFRQGEYQHSIADKLKIPQQTIADKIKKFTENGENSIFGKDFKPLKKEGYLLT